jgi:hypothetical protein
MEKPIPYDPPVIQATLPFNENISIAFINRSFFKISFLFQFNRRDSIHIIKDLILSCHCPDEGIRSGSGPGVD